MPSIRAVMKYSNLNYHEALELPVDTFALMRKHAFIEDLNQTEEGRQYLADCERLAKVEPDYEALRSMAGYKREEISCPT